MASLRCSRGTFEAEVISLASTFGRKVCNDAIRAMDQDDTLLAMLLLSRLKDKLDPETAYAPQTVEDPVSE